MVERISEEADGIEPELLQVAKREAASIPTEFKNLLLQFGVRGYLADPKDDGPGFKNMLRFFGARRVAEAAAKAYKIDTSAFDQEAFESFATDPRYRQFVSDTHQYCKKEAGRKIRAR